MPKKVMYFTQSTLAMLTFWRKHFVYFIKCCLNLKKDVNDCCCYTRLYRKDWGSGAQG